jgi:hypothetical protein
VAFRRALRLDRGNAKYVRVLAATLSTDGRYRESIALRHSFGIDSAEDAAALADDYLSTGNPAKALLILDEARAIHRQSAKTEVIRAFSLLSQEKYLEGFESFEARFDAGWVTSPRTQLPTWDGRLKDGLRLLIYFDQGMGDGLMKARFLSWLPVDKIQLTVVTPPPLTRLFRETLQGATIIDQIADERMFDAIISIGSLPYVLGFREKPPKPIKLEVPLAARERATTKLEPFAGSFHVGVCWTGNLNYPKNHRRSLRPAELLPLAEVPGTRLFSLYKGADQAALQADGMAGHILDSSSTDADLADTAALIDALDLVISTDTAIAHLAGCLGRPVWNLLPAESFWQYGVSGVRTPWYPSMRLFRQTEPGNWSSTVSEARTALTDLVKDQSNASLT